MSVDLPQPCGPMIAPIQAWAASMATSCGADCPSSYRNAIAPGFVQHVANGLSSREGIASCEERGREASDLGRMQCGHGSLLVPRSSLLTSGRLPRRNGTSATVSCPAVKNRRRRTHQHTLTMLAVVAQRAWRQHRGEAVRHAQVERPRRLVDKPLEMVDGHVFFALAGRVPQHRQLGRSNAPALCAYRP